jgi:nucleotide-binding universal stress UspA family protein
MQNKREDKAPSETHAMTQLKHILVAVDFGDSSREALETAVELAKRFDARLTLTHTCEVPVYAYPGMAFAAVDLFGTIEDIARQALAATLADVQKRIPGAKAVLTLGVAAEQTLAVIAAEHPDLVVVGTHGRKGVPRFMLGSVAEKIVRQSPVPVLTVRLPQDG